MAKKDRKFKDPQDLIDFVKQQINVEIKENDTFKYRPRKAIAYMEIPDNAPLRSLLCREGIKLEGHMKNRYWVYLV